MGARAYRASHSKNPQVEIPDMIVDQHALFFQFRRDEADLKQVSGQRRAGAWARVLDRADLGSDAHVPSPLPAAVVAATTVPLSAGDKRARVALQAGAVEREVDDVLVDAKRASVTRCTYWGMPAWHVDTGHGIHLFYSVAAEEAWLIEKGLDLSKLCRHVLIGSGSVPWRVACKKDKSAEGHSSASDRCHTVPTGYKPALFRISSIDGHIGPRPGDEGGSGGHGRGRGGGRGGRGDDASSGGSRGKGAGRGRGAPPDEGGERSPGPVLLQRGAGRGRGAPPPPAAEVCAPADDDSAESSTRPFAGLGQACGCSSHEASGIFDDPVSFPPGLCVGVPAPPKPVRAARCAPSHDGLGSARVVSLVTVHDDVESVQVVPARPSPDHVCVWVQAECGHCPRLWWVCAPGRNPGNGCGAEWGCGIDHVCAPEWRTTASSLPPRAGQSVWRDAFRGAVRRLAGVPALRRVVVPVRFSVSSSLCCS